jgi:hypothetical protein
MMVELLSVAAVFVGGCLLVRAAGLTGWGILPFGMVAGICLQIAIALVQVVTTLPTTPVLTLILTCALPAAWWLVRWGQGHDVRIPLHFAAAVLAGLAAVVVLLRAANLLKWHIDSFTYMMTSALLAEDTYHAGMSAHQVTKRMLGVPVLHAPAQLAGESYLRSITPLLAAATVGILVWLLQRGLRDRLDRATAYGFTALAVLALVTNNRFVFSAFYLNGHLLAATLTLVIAGGGWLLLSRDDPALRAIQLVAIPAAVVTRPEGALLAALALVPTLLSARVPIRHRAAACAVLGVSTLAWQGSVLWVHYARDAAIPLSVYGTAAIGMAALLVIGALRWSTRLRHPVRLLWLAEAGLWLALLGFVVRDPDIFVDSLRATVRNVSPAGAWGTSLVVLAVLGLVAILLTGTERLASPLRFPVTTFLPVAFLLAYLREEGAYRVGAGDSLSRMFMQVVPLAVMFVAVAFASADWDRVRSIVTKRREVSAGS